MKERNGIPENIFSNDEEKRKLLESFFSKYSSIDNFLAVWINGNNILPKTIENLPGRGNILRIVLIFEGLPIVPENLMRWRNWAAQKRAFDIKVLFYEDAKGDVEKFLENNLGDWLKPRFIKEDCFIRKGSFVRLSGKKAHKGDPTFLTLQFGKMGELLSYLDWVRERFRKAYNVEKSAADKYLEFISKCLKKPDMEKSESYSLLKVKKSLDLLPRILLLGETGVGKTLFARYLAGRGRFTRISIPEYLKKEDMFEYEMFGYTSGAYTGGREEGSRGILLENVGGVIFLDEIGEASETIQRKLLAFMDDYMVKPKGWSGSGFYCPVLIVGATNQFLDTDDDKERWYRNDFIQRFTDIRVIPPLRDRKENFPMLLDCLLQNAGINIDGAIEEIGKEAYDFLFNKQYEKGNFRELENLVRSACLKARMDSRTYLVKQDFE